LLIQSRAMDRLPGWAGNLEVFHGTAPLVSATGQPLPPATLEDLRRREAVIWTENGALVPMRDRDAWDVVGAVAVRPSLSRWPRWYAVIALALAVVLGAGVAAGIGTPHPSPGAARVRGARGYAASAVLLGLAAYGDARSGAAA